MGYTRIAEKITTNFEVKYYCYPVKNIRPLIVKGARDTCDIKNVEHIQIWFDLFEVVKRRGGE